ncbi:MAG: chromosome segregation protein ScpA [Verrucomicrobia bacterium]|nr:chromosome segregation protein ScpA [Verrucomicrobiota bacterium]
MTEYKVQFEVFEGPLDLLLYLVKKEEVDIYQVNLTKLATQFLEYVELMRQLDLDIAGEFLVMASTLMYIKSRELLPVDQQVATEGEEEGDDPRWELIRRLVEYKKFKDAAGQLQALEWRQEHSYPRTPGKPQFDSPPQPAEASLFDLIGAVNAILNRFQPTEPTRDIFDDRWTVSEKLEIIRRLIQEQPVLRFFELFADSTSRSEVVVTFLALLELIRLRVLVATQAHPFGDIELRGLSALESLPPAGAAEPAVAAAGEPMAPPDSAPSPAPAVARAPDSLPET